MKSLILGLAIVASGSAFAMDPAAQFVESTLNSGIQLISQQKSADQTQQICSLVTSSFDNMAISQAWLGTYQTSNDMNGVINFMNLTPSILATKIMSLAGRGLPAITVSQTATDLTNGNFSVDVTVAAGNQTLMGQVMVETDADGNFLITDATASGMSAVSLLGADIQKQLDAAAAVNPDTAVSDVVTAIQADPNFVMCP